MTMANGSGRPSQAGRLWLLIGIALLAYCVAGNWLVLPGYRRFLAQDAAGGEVGGAALIWGATRTIAWMLSFHVGALCVAYAALRAQGDAVRGFRRGFLACGAVWIGLWAIPGLPGPYTAFFASTGVIIAVFWSARANATRDGTFFASSRDHWRIAGYFFFALATWDICGLGSVGGILDPDGAARAASQGLVVAQTSKLIVELAIAWLLVAVAALPVRRF
jgi:hypothetical protein